MSMTRTLNVMEIYTANQGEGINIGQPSVFVRLWGCNLRCTWCDTSYSISLSEWKASAERGRPFARLEVTNVVNRISEIGQTISNVVITGGEPLVQARSLAGLLGGLSKAGYRITVETNGTIFYPALLRPPFGGNILWSISPKPPTSQTERVQKRYTDWPINTLVQWCQAPRVQLKFVVGDVTDLDDVYEVLCALVPKKMRYAIPVILQPNGNILTGSRDTNRMVREYLAFLANIQDTTQRWPFNLRVLPQLHALMFGRERFK